MSIKKDLAKIAVQEERLQFQNFDADTAWKLGNRLKANAETRGVAVTIEIRVGKETIFFFAMQGAKRRLGAAQAQRRRPALAQFLRRRSLAAGRRIVARNQARPADARLRAARWQLPDPCRRCRRDRHGHRLRAAAARRPRDADRRTRRDARRAARRSGSAAGLSSYATGADPVSSSPTTEARCVP